jgi:hypothetical protein
MVSNIQLQLGCPLFCIALIVLRAKWDSTVQHLGNEPPKLQTVVQFCYSNSHRSQINRRKRIAVAAMKIAASVFQRAGHVTPAGECPPGNEPQCLAQLSGWLCTLACIAPTEALQLLADNLHTVPCTLFNTVECEYNRAARATGRAQVLPGTIASSLALLRTALSPLPVLSAYVGSAPSVPCTGRFYYIAAGIGCGILEMEQVCALVQHAC